ncbi:MAG: hypothetical protein M3Q81_05390 [bacterium]|nr:hypothetical protein [bacterium]
MGSKRKDTDMSTSEVEVKIFDSEAGENSADTTTEATPAASTQKVKKGRVRSGKYQIVRSQVDKTKAYDPFAAIELVKKLSYSHFDGTITADAVLKEAGFSTSLTFPHSTGKTIRVAIVDDAVLAQLESGVIEFDVLITEPRFMPQLAKHARTLGPRGLMPNPKNGTITPKPELKKQELEGGKITLKTEKKAPLMHISIGKASMETKDLLENLTTLTTALAGKIVKLTVSATMSPSVRVLVEKV